MRAGLLRHRLTLEKPTEAVGAWGDGTPTYTTQATVWGQVEGITGLDRGGIVAEAEYRVRTRYRSDVDPRWRIGWGTRKLGILSAVDPDGRTRELLVFAREIV